MNPAKSEVPVSKAAFYTGWVLTILSVALLTLSATMKFARPPMVVEGMRKSGFDLSLLLGIGILEVVCTLFYLIPRTSVLGAILLTGYLGGAIVTHVRMGEPYWIPVVLGIVIWLGIYLREPRLRALIPIRIY